MRASLSLLLLATCLMAEWRLADSKTVTRPIRGAGVAADGSLYTWGGELRRWNAKSLESERLALVETREGGCLFDVDRDGLVDLVAPTSQGLAWFRAPRFKAEVIDSGAVVWDCLGAELLGHRGVLVVHRGMQLRFYEPGKPKWSYQEVYSFYTPSEQGGLLLRDIDGDGRPDLVCGNYWLQSPASWELHWRLFAINTLSDKPRSASERLAFLGSKLVWAESRETPARLAVFTPRADPKLLWRMEILSSELAAPEGVAVDGVEILVAENAGENSRLWRWGGSVIATGWPTIRLEVDTNSLWQIGERGVRRFDRAPDSGDNQGVAR